MLLICGRGLRSSSVSMVVLTMLTGNPDSGLLVHRIRIPVSLENQDTRFFESLKGKYR